MVISPKLSTLAFCNFRMKILYLFCEVFTKDFLLLTGYKRHCAFNVVSFMFFPGGSDGKESACNVGAPGSIPDLGRSPGGGSGYPLQYSCLENSMDREAWWAVVHELAESDKTEETEHTHGSTLSFQSSALTFFRQIPRSGIAGSYGITIFSFYKESSYCFPLWLHQFTFSPKYTGLLFSPHPHQLTLVSVPREESPSAPTFRLTGCQTLRSAAFKVGFCCCCCLLTQCLTLCDPMYCSPLSFSVHGILQARILEWVAISSSRGSSWPKDQTWVSCLAGGFFTPEPPGKPL